MYHGIEHSGGKGRNKLIFSIEGVATVKRWSITIMMTIKQHWESDNENNNYYVDTNKIQRNHTLSISTLSL